MGHYDTCRPENCGRCGQALEYCNCNRVNVVGTNTPRPGDLPGSRDRTPKKEPMPTTGKEHKVRSWRHLFEPINDGSKHHDLRKNDRDYHVGDTLVLQEFDIQTGKYTGREAKRKISYMTSRDFPCAFSSAVLPNDYCILSLEKLV